MTKFLTPEGLKKLEGRARDAQNRDAPKNRGDHQRSQRAGRLTENAEYSEAKRQQADNERRIMELENDIRTSQVSSFNKKSKSSKWDRM